MPTIFTAAEKSALEYVRNYLTRASTDRPLDDVSANVLSKYHARFGYDSEIKMREDLRDATTLTLIKVMLYINLRA